MEERITADNVSDVDAIINLPIMNKRRISIRKKQVENYFKSLSLPPQCYAMRKDIGQELECDQCLALRHDKLFSFFAISGMGDEIVQIAFDAMFKREDMGKSLKRRRADVIFYVGRKSAWGSVEDGTYRP